MSSAVSLERGAAALAGGFGGTPRGARARKLALPPATLRGHPGLDRIMGGRPAPVVSLRSLRSLRSLGGGLACQPALPRGLEEVIR